MNSNLLLVYCRNIRIKLMTAVCIFACQHLQAEDMNLQKSKILNEVKQLISDDVLANQIAEIRFRREVLSNQLPAVKKDPAIEPTTPPALDFKQVNTLNGLDTSFEDKKPNLATKSKSIIDTQISKNYFYSAIGSHLKVGFIEQLTKDVGARFEILGLKQTDYSKSINNSSFFYKQNNLSLGIYADWNPTESPLLLSIGLNINRIRASLIPSSSNLNINGNSVILGSDIYKVDFKFPTVTPYFGVGYQSKNEHETGLHFYGDAGLMLGKYDAIATTSLIGNQNVKGSDIDAELNSLRNRLYKWNFIPLATIGIQYKFN